MKLQSSVLFVRDIEISEKFYTSVLKEKLKHDFGTNKVFESGLALWQLREDHIIAKVCKNTTSVSGNSFELYYETENFEATLNHIGQFEIEYLHKTQTEAWGQQTLRFFDPDSHLIEIGETLHAFVGRMYIQDVSIKDISSRTHIPICTVEALLQEIATKK
ncbi:MAG: hypothetical protein IPO21_02125 [Bacteroidales bacterium]|nr:hypothetical protein [Bacteroidales bacterium]